MLLLCVLVCCYDLRSKCTKIPGLNGKERAGTSVYYMTGNIGRWRVVLVLVLVLVLSLLLLVVVVGGRGGGGAWR